MFRIRSLVPLLAVALIIGATPLFGRIASDVTRQDFDTIRRDAERLYAESAYARALSLYEQARGLELTDEQRRWTMFRIGDCRWRSLAGTNQRDNTGFDQARSELLTVINAIEDPRERDDIWAGAQRSLGDFWWTRQRSANYSAAWSHYQSALDYWAGSSDIDTARREYTEIVFDAATPPDNYGRGWWPGHIPPAVLENVAEIAESDVDRTRAHYLLARSLERQGGLYRTAQKIEQYYGLAIEAGRSNPWHDEALFHFATYLSTRGAARQRPDGQWEQKPDFVRAVALFQQIVLDYRIGESAYADDAARQIENITGEQLSIAIPGTFLPGSEIQFQTQWRNVDTVKCSIYPINMRRDYSARANRSDNSSWLERIKLNGRKAVVEWSIDTGDDGTHHWGARQEDLPQPLALGAYVLEAKAGAKRVREILLVTDITAVVKRFDDRHLVFVADAMSGAPIGDAKVDVWHSRRTNRTWSHQVDRGATDESGVFIAEIDDDNYRGMNGTVLVEIGDRQAMVLSQNIWSPGRFEGWRLFTAADRPAYRPGDDVQWKVTARQMTRGSYRTPAGESVYYEIEGPQGKIEDGTVELNSFGSGWDDMTIGDDAALGEYRISFYPSTKKNTRLGGVTLFRIEEYKLPEFEVTVATPRDDDGRPVTYLLGDSVEASIEASYYFGGPVGNANVEVLIRQKQYWHSWQPPRAYPWLYENHQRHHWGWNQGQIIKQESTRTDAFGRASITFDTPAEQGQSFEYVIEARVTDASRREITGSSSVRVTAQRHYVYPKAERSIYAPGTTATVAFNTRDANNEPVSVKGSVRVARQIWREVWIDPAGREFTGVSLDNVRRSMREFPPPNQRGWLCQHRGYDEEEILVQSIATNDDGEAELSFTPTNAGYYSVTWSSIVENEPPVIGLTHVWVAPPGDIELAVQSDGVQVIVEKDTVRPGEDAVIVVTAPVSDRHVLVTLEGRSLYEHRVVHLQRNAKLVRLPIDARCIPNIRIAAVMVDRTMVHQALQNVVVPPVDQYLDVEVAADSDAYEPRDDGTFIVKVTDVDGKPVKAELSLGVVDESVYYIQSPYAGDPRQFFFGDTQPHVVPTTSSVQQRGFVRLVRRDDGAVIDARNMPIDDEGGAWRARRSGGGGGGQFGAPATESMMADADFAGAVAGSRIDSLASGRENSVGLRVSSKSIAPTAAAPGGGSGGAGAEPNVVVRTDFRSTIFWKPDLKTDEHGVARTTVTFADSLTRWKGTVFAVANGDRFGTGETVVRTRQPLIARLQAPRFFTCGDELILSGVFNNNTDDDMTITPTLDADGVLLTGMIIDGHSRPIGDVNVTVPAGGDKRVDWLVYAERAGEATIRLTAIGDADSDAMEKSYPVYAHGIEKFIASSGKVRGDQISVKLDLPAARRVEDTVMRVQVTGSMAVTALDALPYLVDYPYGCTEQTMSRFVPLVATAKTLRDLGLEPGDALARTFGGIDPAFVDKTHNDPEARRKAFVKLDAVAQQGLKRIYDFQHGDGGWGWWKDGSSDPFMSAYVLWGLSTAEQADLDVKPDVMANAARYLELQLVEAENRPDLQAWMLHAITSWRHGNDDQKLTSRERKAYANLLTRLDQLNAYTRSLVAISAHQAGQTSDAHRVLRTLENGVFRDNRPDTSVVIGNAGQNAQAVIGTAHWGNDGVEWRWSHGAVESTAWALRAMLLVDPTHELIEPTTNWLIKNRRGAHWSNTRDTAMVVMAMNDYLRVSGELSSDLAYEVFVNGRSVGTRAIAAKDMLAAPTWFDVDPAYIRDGTNEIQIIKRAGDGPIYFSAQATFFSLEEPIPAAGNELFVRRQYFKLVPRDTLLKGVVYDRLPLDDGGYINSGERVEVIVTVEAKNDYEYLVFEDLKPAGFEAVQVRSGEAAWIRQLSGTAIKAMTSGDVAERFPATRLGGEYTGRSRWVHQELRDRTTAIFVDKLGEGIWEIRFDYRAEVPGEFHGLPLMAHAMYVPEIRANSDETRITVIDRTD
ncbi:MAG: alpha-2-macroglobulin family protein [Planctomycetota bacterium]